MSEVGDGGARGIPNLLSVWVTGRADTDRELSETLRGWIDLAVPLVPSSVVRPLVRRRVRPGLLSPHQLTPAAILADGASGIDERSSAPDSGAGRM